MATQTETYSYDANGNMVNKSEGSKRWRYTWDFENRMSAAWDRKQRVRYHYDALGRRVQRVLGYGKENTKFTYDGLDVLADDNSGTLTKYQNGPGIDNKLRVQTGSDVKYFLADHLGSTNGLADSTGTITASTDYDSFGSSTNGSFPSRYQYTGREFDSFIGLQFSRARFYDPNLGRFISEDPIGFIGSTNLFSYVENRPIEFSDPLGLFPSRWPWDYHQDITRRALAGLASSRQIGILANEQQDFDSRTQDSIFAPYHAMRRPGQTVEDARREANDFVKRKICEARLLQSQGLDDDAMRALGQALHTLQDSSSPAHFGFQEAWPNNLGGIIWNWRHYSYENFDPGAGSVADFQSMRAWGYFTGSVPMPNDFFVDNYYDGRDIWGFPTQIPVR